MKRIAFVVSWFYKTFTPTTILVTIFHIQDGGDEHNFERGPPKVHSDKVWLKLTKWFLTRRFLNDVLLIYALAWIILRGFPLKNMSNSHALHPRWPPLLKIEISSNGQNCFILSQNVPKFGLYKFLIGSYVKLSSAVAAISVGGLKCRTQIWKGTTQKSIQQSLVEIGSVVSEEKIFFYFIPPFF
jgi:hypothetical protein